MTSSPTAARPRTIPALAAGATVLALALAGCSTATPSGTAGTASGEAAPVSNGAAQISVSVEKVDGLDQCVPDFATAPAGPVTFTVANKDASGVSEVELLSDKRILGERENIIPGLKAVSFTVTLPGGQYQLYCPGAGNENTPFTVTGSAASAQANGVTGLLKEGTDGYAKYVSGQVDSLVLAVAALQKAVDSGDVEASQKAYAEARPFFERIEPVAESFPDLDPALDLRVADVEPGAEWTGFHPLEKDLFEAQAVTDGSKALAAGIVRDVDTLKSLTAELESSGAYKPEELANGASGLLEEVQSSKITGEEEAYSKLDLVDFAANIEGSQQAFEYLKPALQEIDPGLTKQISTQFETVTTALQDYQDPAALGGWKPYTDELKASDGAKLTALIQALQAPLAKISEKVATV
ncbi:iron uptake system component EfeO [Arthrobacter stackebrandtii]|uniref:Iron uptake system component EfeO n=1 Tax=Arthrobacter stackebrandtii TaxID=272161 RepID=A0ABS4YRL0_9MICC|nr:iron uptake system protein EfeO [Arthrobacter stackebrandtii]MBP2411394.1 iron uptake system component EfeO [Arthrobacter stackebrandtii]PYH00317.1 peptidase M75 [Arthrobacter stackebrandtii]